MDRSISFITSLHIDFTSEQKRMTSRLFLNYSHNTVRNVPGLSEAALQYPPLRKRQVGRKGVCLLPCLSSNLGSISASGCFSMSGNLLTAHPCRKPVPAEQSLESVPATEDCVVVLTAIPLTQSR